MRAMGEAALGFVIDFIQGLPDAPAVNVDRGVEAARAVRSEPPEEGGCFDEALETIREAARYAYETCGPGYVPFVPGGGLYAAALAQFLTAGVNRFPNLWGQSPAMVQIEQDVVRWICDLFGYGSDARGVLTSGGSIANLSAIVTARVAKLGEDFLDGTYYVSEQVHASVTKSAGIAGFGARNLRKVPVDAELRMDADALRDLVRADRAAGDRPFLVVPSAGTTNTGAIDPLADIVEIARAEDLWLHVDAAYGGFFQLTERGRTAFRGIGDADSITLDPHKGMFLPYGTGSLIVRDGARLREAHYAGADYLQDFPPEAELPNFTEYSAELSRENRGLRVWLPLRLHGVAAFREALDEKLDLAGYLDDALSSMPALEVPWRPQLTVVAFRLAERDDEANQRFLDRINASKRVVVSSTMLGGRYTLRACILNHRTHRDRIDELIEIVGKAAAEA
jgi:aromatic-L-amino-acid/L-tryptophan decarboxylase